MCRFFCGEPEYQSFALNSDGISLWRRIIFGYLFLPVIVTGLIIFYLRPETVKFLVDQMGSLVIVILTLSILNFITLILLFRTSLHFLFPPRDETSIE
jgi:hypothetical protein